MKVGLAAPAGEERELVLAATVGAADAIERTLGLAVQIRWPDAVMVNRKQVAEVVLRGGELSLTVRVNDAAELGTWPPLASLCSTDGVERDEEEVEESCRTAVETALAEWRSGGIEALYERLAPRDFLRGRRVSVDGVDGVAVAVDRDGRLELDLDRGERRVLGCGTVTYER